MKLSKKSSRELKKKYSHCDERMQSWRRNFCKWNRYYSCIKIAPSLNSQQWIIMNQPNNYFCDSYILILKHTQFSARISAYFLYVHTASLSALFGFLFNETQVRFLMRSLSFLRFKDRLILICELCTVQSTTNRQIESLQLLRLCDKSWKKLYIKLLCEAIKF